MKLTYWVAHCENDHRCYNLRAKTRREIVAALADIHPTLAQDYGPPLKVVVEYDDGFDLVEQAMGESGIDEGN